MTRSRVIGYTVVFAIILILGYAFFMVPMEREFSKYEVIECEASDTIGMMPSMKDKVSFENNILKIPQKPYLEKINYCAFRWLDSDLDYLKDSLDFGDAVEQGFFDLITKEKLKLLSIDTISLDPKAYMEAILLGERSLIYANNSKNNRLFFKAFGRFWLNTISAKLTAVSELNPGIKYDQNFKILIDRCRQNKYTVELNYTNSEKFINYLVDQRYAYIMNRVWIGTSPLFKVFLIIAGIVTAYAYFLFMMKVYSLIKNKLR